MSQDIEAQGGAEARIRQLVEQVKALQGRVAELEPAAAEVGSYRTQLEELKGTTKAEREALRLEREIYASGITEEEGIEYVQHAYSKLAADARPPIGEWLANREALPRAVRAYMPEANAAAPAAAAPETSRMRLPASSATTLPNPAAAPSVFSMESIAKMSAAELRANMAAITSSR